ncbi:sigma factor G inhibitor Gin [Niallia sp. XMNu-256]|uniref:sigma factor G inhibitor Gin n=1 Tax=Niallia sp. XMNu-256 TaxID=3082444 RepID=UPI0030D5783C
MNSATRDERGEVCVICEVHKEKGIHLYTSFICSDCEKDMIATETNDPKYKYFLSKLRKVTAPEIFS